MIFIKTTKTAGTSVEVDLSQRLEPEAVVTPIIPPLPGHEPRNYMNDAGDIVFFNHMKASEIRAHFGASRFEEFYRFTIEREPVDKCISHFHMLKNRRDQHGLSDEARTALSWAQYVEKGNFPIDLTKYNDPDQPEKLLVNRVLAYETLSRDLRILLDALGLPGWKLSTRAKSEYRHPRYIEPEDVTPSQRARIYEHFAETHALTGLYPPP